MQKCLDDDDILKIIESNRKPFKFKVGDLVRITKYKKYLKQSLLQ